jgi:hypothetical protein
VIDTGKLLIADAFERRPRKAQGGIEQIIAKRLRGRRIVLRDVRDDFSEVC